MALKSGIFAGILALILAFISKIPIFPPENWAMDFKIFSLNNIDFYFWGYLIDGEAAFTATIGAIPESLISISVWLMIFLIGLNSIMASTSKAKLNNSRKLFNINILLSMLILIVFGTIIIFLITEEITSFFNIIGFGYYFTIIILILNIIALKNLKKEF